MAARERIPIEDRTWCQATVCSLYAQRPCTFLARPGYKYCGHHLPVGRVFAPSTLDKWRREWAHQAALINARVRARGGTGRQTAPPTERDWLLLALCLGDVETLEGTDGRA